MSAVNSQDGFLFKEDGLIEKETGGEGSYKAGKNGVVKILATADNKVEFICFEEGQVMVYVLSKMGYPAIYPLHPVKIEKPVKAILMDLDGTSVRSEEFWVWVIEQSTARLLGDPKFTLEEADAPFVSGHSVSEHLQHCIDKYCPDKSLVEARKYYFEITHREMKAILEGHGRDDAFVPTPGLKDFLYAVKEKGIKIGLVTSGLYEKAWPEIYAAFKQLGMGDPREFYDAIITAGFAIRKGEVGTLGELEPKPHPWLYAETAKVGLGIDISDRHHVVGVEDSGAGVVSIRLAGFSVLGFDGGNIKESKTLSLCSHYSKTLDEIYKIIT